MRPCRLGVGEDRPPVMDSRCPERHLGLSAQRLSPDDVSPSAAHNWLTWNCGAYCARSYAIDSMARPEGFEPPTPWFVARYSIQLSYGRVIN